MNNLCKKVMESHEFHRCIHNSLEYGLVPIDENQFRDCIKEEQNGMFSFCNNFDYGKEDYVKIYFNIYEIIYDGKFKDLLKNKEAFCIENFNLDYQFILAKQSNNLKHLKILAEHVQVIYNLYFSCLDKKEEKKRFSFASGILKKIKKEQSESSFQDNAEQEIILKYKQLIDFINEKIAALEDEQSKSLQDAEEKTSDFEIETE